MKEEGDTKIRVNTFHGFLLRSLRWYQMRAGLRARFLWRFRCFWLNSHSNILISPYIFFSSSARIQSFFNGDYIGGDVRIDKDASVSDGVILSPFGGSILLSEGCFIGPYCVLSGHGGLIVGKNTLIAAHTVVIPTNHNFSNLNIPIKNQGATDKGIQIGDDVWIGAGCKILDGVTIGNGCVVGAGAVVTRSLPENAVAVGVPARVIKFRATNC